MTNGFRNMALPADVPPFEGWNECGWVPRALPWAVMYRPFGARARARARARGAFGKLLVTALLSLMAVGCPGPGQYGGDIHVEQAGFGARMEQLCRLGVSDPEMLGACLRSQSQPEPEPDDIALTEPPDAANGGGSLAEPAITPGDAQELLSAEASARMRHQRLER